jgi:ribosomal protein L17
MASKRKDLDAAIAAVPLAEHLLGQVMVATTSATTETKRARVMAQALVTAAIILKLELSKTVIKDIPDYGAAVDDLIAQLRAAYDPTDGTYDIDKIVMPASIEGIEG